MKHIMANGNLINLDKKWHHLSMKQKNWIVDRFRETYIYYLNRNKMHPGKEGNKEIVDTVYCLIQERDIWIPYNEIRKAYSSKLNRYRKLSI